jgi:proteasome accessory factor C
MSALIDRRLRGLLQLIAHVRAQGGRCHVSDVSRTLGIAPREVKRLVLGASACGREPFGPGDLIELFLDGDWITLDNDLDVGRPLPLSRSEALALVIALSVIGDTEILGEPAQRARSALSEALARPLGDDDPAFDERFELASGDTVDRQVMRDLLTAYRERRVVEIEYYTAGRDELSRRTLRPQLLLMSSGAWYVVGYDSVRHDVGVFKVERIRHLALTDQRFERRSSFKPERYRRPGKLFLGNQHSKARVRFTGALAGRVRAAWPADAVEEHADGSVIGAMEYGGTAAICDWLLARGDDAEVCEPGELRDAVARRARAALALYAEQPE